MNNDDVLIPLSELQRYRRMESNIRIVATFGAISPMLASLFLEEPVQPEITAPMSIEAINVRIEEIKAEIASLGLSRVNE